MTDRERAERVARDVVRLAVMDHDSGGYEYAGINEIMANRVRDAILAERADARRYAEHLLDWAANALESADPGYREALSKRIRAALAPPKRKRTTAKRSTK